MRIGEQGVSRRSSLWPAGAAVAASVGLLVLASPLPASAQGPAPPAAEAAAPPGSEAPAVPLGVVEVVTGGNWAEGSRSGVYRAVVVQGGREGARTVSVHLQWISENEDGDAVAITASLPIRELQGVIVPSASVSLDSDVANDVQLTIAAPEAADPAARLIVVRAAGPGRYVVVPPAPAAAAAQPPPAQPAASEPPRPAPKRPRH